MQLKPAAEPQWIVLCEGLSVLMRPITTPVMVEARHLYNQLRVADLGEAADSEPVQISGQKLQYLMSTAMIAAGALEWSGLSDVDGSPLPHPTLEQVKLLLDQNPPVFDEADAVYCSPFYILLAEKKGFGRSQTGTMSSTAPDSAVDAKNSTATPQNPVPTTSTKPKPRKAA